MSLSLKNDEKSTKKEEGIQTIIDIEKIQNSKTAKITVKEQFYAVFFYIIYHFKYLKLSG